MLEHEKHQNLHMGENEASVTVKVSIQQRSSEQLLWSLMDENRNLICQ